MSVEKVPYCTSHGIVSNSHRCSVFDGAPWQTIRSMSLSQARDAVFDAAVAYVNAASSPHQVQLHNELADAVLVYEAAKERSHE